MKIRMGAALALALSGLVVNGCGLPAIVAVASYTADGMSLIGTGKSISDHALSTVVNEDCALWRIIRGGAICLKPAGTAVVVAAVPAGDDVPPVGDVAPEPAPAAAVEAVTVAQATAVPAAPLPPLRPAVRSAVVPPQMQALLLAGPPPVAPAVRAVLALPDPVPPPRTKPPVPLELAEMPTPPLLPSQRKSGRGPIRRGPDQRPGAGCRTPGAFSWRAKKEGTVPARSR